MQCATSYMYLGVVTHYRLIWDSWTECLSTEAQQRKHFYPWLQTKCSCALIEIVLSFWIICWFGNTSEAQRKCVRKIATPDSKLLESTEANKERGKCYCKWWEASCYVHWAFGLFLKESCSVAPFQFQLSHTWLQKLNSIQVLCGTSFAAPAAPILATRLRSVWPPVCLVILEEKVAILRDPNDLVFWCSVVFVNGTFVGVYFGLGDPDFLFWMV